MILPTGAYSQDTPTPELGECIDGVGCLITREAAKECQKDAVDRRKVQRFDELERECRKADGQLDQCTADLNVARGKRDECRDDKVRATQRANIWQARAVDYKRQKDRRWKRWKVLTIAAGVGLGAYFLGRVVQQVSSDGNRPGGFLIRF